MFQELKNKYNYKNSGVDIEKADNIIKAVSNNFLDKNFKNFAGVFNFENSTFVSCTDGIGSKIIPLIKYNLPYVIANDLVAMNINDLVTMNARPLFFLDYIASNTLDNNLDEIIKNTIINLKQILAEYNCTLLGGEISELSSLIKENYFDMAGFMVGVKNNQPLKEIQKNDVIIGFNSNGLHSNGFSLIRKLYEDKKIDENIFKNSLKPTKIYFKEIYNLFQNDLIKSACNITGGGIEGNLKRIIPKNLTYKLNFASIKNQEIFEIIKNFVDLKECFNVFNMGVGFIVVANQNDACKILNTNNDAFILGEIYA